MIFYIFLCQEIFYHFIFSTSLKFSFLKSEGKFWWLADLENDPYQAKNLLLPQNINEEYMAIFKELRAKIDDYYENHVPDDPLAERDGNGYPICTPRDSTDWL